MCILVCTSTCIYSIYYLWPLKIYIYIVLYGLALLLSVTFNCWEKYSFVNSNFCENTFFHNSVLFKLFYNNMICHCMYMYCIAGDFSPQEKTRQFHWFNACGQIFNWLINFMYMFKLKLKLIINSWKIAMETCKYYSCLVSVITLLF